MSENIYIGNFTKGLATNRKPFNIDNDAFPFLWNFYSWRGRIKKKRGTTLLGRLQIQTQSVLNSAPPLSWQIGTLFTLVGTSGSGNLIQTSITGITQAINAVVTLTDSLFEVGDVITISGVVGMTEVNGGIYTIVSRNISANTITLNVNSTGFTVYGSGGILSLYDFTGITPGSVILSDGTNTYTDNSMGVLTTSSMGVSGTINYATGAVTITGGVSNATIIGKFTYYPGLPAMGLQDYLENIPVTDTTGLFRYPLLLAFDTVHAYQYNQGNSPGFYNVSFYKYTNNPVEWSGTDYQLFWSTNFANAFWAVNDKPGLHFLNGTYTSGSPGLIITFTFVSNGVPFTNLIVGDRLWFNEWSGGSTINGLVGTVSAGGTPSSGIYTVTFTSSQTVAGTGIAQLLTNSIPDQDGIRWYDGDPTNGSGFPIGNDKGWVNFAPPLTATTKGIANLPAALYYLVGAQIVIPFKNRLLFFGVWVQTSSGPPINLQDVVIWSWIGTPYYTPGVFPIDQTADPTGWYIDQAGKGGYISAGIQQPIVTVNNNEDVLLVGFTKRQTRFIYTGNGLAPFAFFTINSELGSSSTFSGITLDRGGLTFGTYGLALTTQQGAQRIDLEIPDEVFTIQGLNSGAFRVNSIRDFFREWVYFSFPVDNSEWKFPTQTLLYNYRDNTWSVLYENYTVHGNFYAQMSKTWAQLTDRTWNTWKDLWSEGIDSALFPRIIAGNPQGYVLTLDEDTDEAFSGAIEAITNNGGFFQITSTNHCLSSANPALGDGDFIYIDGVLGLITPSNLNGLIGQVDTVIDANNFIIDIPYSPFTTVYLGGGQYSRLCQPLLQTKQFPIYWDQGRQVRLGRQQYLLDTTANGQVTLNIYLSQDDATVWNKGPIVPSSGVTNNSLEYSQILYTCPESTNLGLTPANVNLQTPTAISQASIWHRVNTSLQGETVQIGITLSEEQMKVYEYATAEITLQGIILTTSPGPLLA